MTDKLTPKTIADLSGPPPGRPYVIHYDPDLPGFGVRITAAGARSFVLNYRANGIERRMTIGSLPAGVKADEAKRIIDDARKEAAKIKAGAKYQGQDPMSVRHSDRAAPTMADLTKRYLSDHAPRKRASSQRDDRSMVANAILPALKNRKVADIRHADIDDLHRKLSKTAPIRANRVVALLSKMFSLAIKWDWRTDNPARGIDRNPEEKRERYLKSDELSRLSAALAAHARRSSANAIRLLLLTGARRGEVLSATWDQFDLAEGVWVKPSAQTKQKKEHRLPLSGPARQLVAAMLRDAEATAKKKKTAVSAYLFPGDDGKPQTEIKRAWASICTTAKISGVRLHDLRHTFASLLVSSGETMPVIGALLGHTQTQTTARYAHLYDDPLRRATERASAIIDSGGGKRSAKIVRFGRH